MTPEPRLSSEMIVSSLLRQANNEGGFGMVLKKGDRISGVVLIICLEKGRNPTLWEKMPTLDGPSKWHQNTTQDIENKENLEEYLARRQKYDPDMWLIELDIADAERLTAILTP